MEYKAIQFELIQSTNPCCWKWIVFLDATRTRTGVALTRADAVLDAELAIEKALEKRGCALREIGLSGEGEGRRAGPFRAR